MPGLWLKIMNPAYLFYGDKIKNPDMLKNRQLFAKYTENQRSCAINSNNIDGISIYQ